MEHNGCADLLDLRETQRAIKLVKDTFEHELANALNLERVSAPLFVLPETGLNDNLGGWEKPVSFEIRQMGKVAEIVHSLAKWKRFALGRYGFAPGEGLYTDMNAIRRDEDTDPLHSYYVDQWDWEVVITREQRKTDVLRDAVEKIYASLLHTHDKLILEYPKLRNGLLPNEISFVTSQELLDMYGDIPSEQREYRYVKEHGACFITGIGAQLSNGERHGPRSPDYDDWTLNGDIIIYYEPLDTAMELSSMGIRVDAQTMRCQLEMAGKTERVHMPFHRAVLADELPLTMGGGIGQSRMCMFMLRKTHIGQVHVSVWPETEQQRAVDSGAPVL